MSNRMIVQRKLEGDEFYKAGLKFQDLPIEKITPMTSFIKVGGGDDRANLIVEHSENMRGLFSIFYQTASLNTLIIKKNQPDIQMEYALYNFNPDEDTDTDMVLKIIKSATDVEYYLLENTEIINQLPSSSFEEPKTITP